MATKFNKYRNIVAEVKKEKYSYVYSKDKVTDGAYMAVNTTFLALGNYTQGNVVIADPNVIQKCNNLPVIEAHKMPINDMAFSPFRSDLLATASDDSTVKFWKIPEGGLKEDIKQEDQHYLGHKKKVLLINFNPCVDNLITTSCLSSLHVLDIIQSEPICSVELKDWPTSLQWNRNGSLIGLTTKAKEIQVLDPRANKMILTTPGFQSTRKQKMAWIDNEYFVVVGFNKNNDREMNLFDIRKVKEDQTMDSPLFSFKIDRLTGILTPYIDYESKLIYLNAKGEGNFFFFDIEPDKFNKLNTLYTPEQALCLVQFERKGLDYNRNEIDRFYKFTPNNEVEIVSMILPRRNPGFDASLYPPLYCGEAVTSLSAWKEGTNNEPMVKEINTIENKWVSKVETFIKKEPVKEVPVDPQEKIKFLEQQVKELKEQLEQANLTIKKLTEEKCKENVINDQPVPESQQPKQLVIEQAPEEKQPEDN